MVVTKSGGSFTAKGVHLEDLQVQKAEDVIQNRCGDVLIKHTVLKADHFPSCHNTKLVPILEGAPNFRKVDGLQVYGVAIPTVTGLRTVLNAMGAQKGQRKVYWQNLREEPLVFINGNPFVVREVDQPFSNLEYTGIDRTRVEYMEVRLKQDILAEAQKFGNQILVMHENEDLSLYDHWEPVTGADVQTPQEVYEELKADGYDVDYMRVPVTDEKAPKDDDFELLIQRLWSVPDDAAVIFNCQMGRGRTTTGTIIASLLYLRKMEAFPVKKGRLETREIVPAWFRSTLSTKSAPPKETDMLKEGMYGVIRSLLRALDKGPEAKAVLDAVIDACSAMQNLREAMASYRSRFLKEAREKQRNTLLNVCLEYLERYYMLISFTAYLASPQFDPGSTAHTPFPEWMADRAELRSILMRLLRRNSMAALELHSLEGGAGGASPGSMGGAPGADGSSGGAGERDVIAARTGAVLGQFSILKEDNFPGMQSAKIPQIIEGAPNFRGLPGMPIYGVGMPTVEGIMAVLKCVSGSTSPNASKRVHALWVNMREEPVVYINGRPFVLREEMRPLKNMMEYAGIDAGRLEAMEERLKKDVLSEALRHGGRILVAHESFEYGHYGQLYDNWEEIDHPDAVQTPAEVYAGLTKQGFAVKYCRVPVTDGTPPTHSDFDQVLSAVMDWGLENPVIFNCQMGIGRTTTGMVMAGLVHMYSEGAMATARTTAQALDDLADPSGLSEYIVAGISPRSDNEHDEYRDEDDEAEPKVWDLAPEEVEEQKALAAGGYVGVRRVARLLEEGENAKRTLDAIIDAASDLINLRVAIMKYRKPRSSYKFIRPELQQRNAAFKKGSSYLERYCLLIAFAFYLEHVGPETCSFSTWMKSRPDLQAALTSIHANPGAALMPLPVSKLPAMYQIDGDSDDDAAGADKALADTRKVLARRRGRTLTRRTILKSYLFQEGIRNPVLPEAPDLRSAQDELPVHSVGSVTSSGLRAVLDHLGASPGGPAHVVISDVREELVAYINGVPYTRREMEMPVAALHHAGIHASQLEELEVLLKEDIQDEAVQWGSRLLVHKELPKHRHHHQRGTAARPVSSGNLQPPQQQSAGGAADHAQGSPLDVPLVAAGGGSAGDDVTLLVDANPGAQVAPYWESLELEDPTSVQTPHELVQSLVEQGYQASYRRIPLSRERTPEADDVAALHGQLLEAHLLGGAGERQVVHLILSRTSTGSSARFVAAALCSYYMRPVRASISGASPPEKGSTSSGGAFRSLDAARGEYRGIMSLCRLLPGGFDAKLTVDSAIELAADIGNLVRDIKKCKEVVDSAPERTLAEDPNSVINSPQFAARQLGVHYLKRYFLLITYRCFLEHGGNQKPDFADWMHQQRELHHLLTTLTLEI